MGSNPQEMETDAPETEKRDTEIKKLLGILDLIITEAGEAFSTRINSQMTIYTVDIDASDDLSGVLMTVFTCLRKENNDKPGFERYKDYKAKIDDVEITIGNIVEKIKNRPDLSLDFLVATPIVELMTLFKASFDEVRTGVTRFRVRKDVTVGVKRTASGAIKDQHTHNISQYGLVNNHIPLLQGITFAPERRTGVIRSLGPLTQCILMVLENRFHTKLDAAIKNSLSMLPMANEISQCLRDAKSPGSVAGVLKELGDILLLTTARSTQKVYMPLLLIKLLWAANHSLNYKWSFSGSDLMKLYNHVICAKSLKFKMRSGASDSLTAEVVFHAMFGTYLDDLGILATITTHKSKWHSRKEVNSVFSNRSSKPAILVTPILFTLVSKMAQALLTKSLGNVDPLSTCRPSFTSVRNRTRTAEFNAYLRTGKTALSYSSDPLQLQFALKKLKDGLMEDNKDDSGSKAGTRPWQKVVDGNWVDSEKIPSETGRYFFGATYD